METPTRRGPAGSGEWGTRGLGRFVSRAALVVLVATPFSRAEAQSVVERVDAPMLADIASGFGSSFVVDGEASEQNPSGAYVRGRIEGTTYAVFPGGCDEEGCRDFRFYAAWTDAEVELEAINGWNAARRFGRAFLDADRDPVVEMDVNVAHGVTTRNLEDNFDWWRATLASFHREVVASP